MHTSSASLLSFPLLHTFVLNWIFIWIFWSWLWPLAHIDCWLFGRGMRPRLLPVHGENTASCVFCKHIRTQNGMQMHSASSGQVPVSGLGLPTTLRVTSTYYLPRVWLALLLKDFIHWQLAELVGLYTSKHQSAREEIIISLSSSRNALSLSLNPTVGEPGTYTFSLVYLHHTCLPRQDCKGKWCWNFLMFIDHEDETWPGIF